VDYVFYFHRWWIFIFDSYFIVTLLPNQRLSEAPKEFLRKSPFAIGIPLEGQRRLPQSGTGCSTSCGQAILVWWRNSIYLFIVICVPCFIGFY
jgi:hypothetical protein